MATAATADDLKGLYAGIGVASTSVDGGPIDDSGTSFKIFAGYSFNKFLALELSYLDGGTAKEAQNFLVPGTPPVSTSDQAENKIFNLSVVGNLPLTESFSLFGKLGYADIDTDTKSSFSVGNSVFTGANDNQRKKLSYGAGATYSYGKSFQLRAEYEGFDVIVSGVHEHSAVEINRFFAPSERCVSCVGSYSFVRIASDRPTHSPGSARRGFGATAILRNGAVSSLRSGRIPLIGSPLQLRRYFPLICEME
jgi:hypothetical protein